MAKTKKKWKKGKASANKKAEQKEPEKIRGVKFVKENKQVLRYLLLFVFFCLIFYLIYYSLWISGSMLLAALMEMTASILGLTLSLSGMEVAVNGVLLSINGFRLEIIDECTAIFSSIVYCSCVLAYPTTLRYKGVGLAFGIPALYGINIFRLFVLSLVGVFYPDLFEFVHVYLWQASFIIFVIVIFLLWLRLVVK